MIDYNMTGVPNGASPQFDPNEYLRSMGIPKEIVAQGDDAVRKYAEDNGINLVPKGQIPQQSPKGPIPMVEPDKEKPETPGEISYSREPNPPQKASLSQITEYYNRRKTEIENDLKEQGLSKKEIRKALDQARKELRAEIEMKFEKMTKSDAKAWLENKKAELKEQNPNMSKKDINKQANIAYQETFGEKPPRSLVHQFFANIFPVTNFIISKIDERNGL